MTDAYTLCSSFFSLDSSYRWKRRHFIFCFSNFSSKIKFMDKNISPSEKKWAIIGFLKEISCLLLIKLLSKNECSSQYLETKETSFNKAAPRHKHTYYLSYFFHFVSRWCDMLHKRADFFFFFFGGWRPSQLWLEW